jgi:hypothetical protein
LLSRLLLYGQRLCRASTEEPSRSFGKINPKYRSFYHAAKRELFYLIYTSSGARRVILGVQVIENQCIFVGDLSARDSAEQLDDLALRDEKDLLGALAAAGETRQLESLDTDYRDTSSTNKIFIPLIPDILDNNTRSSEAVEFGRRLFWRWSNALHGLLCEPSGADDDLRNRLLSALKLKDGGTVAFIAVFLASHFKLDAAEAALIAALLVQIFGKPTGEEICKTWSLSLGREKSSA